MNQNICRLDVGSPAFHVEVHPSRELLAVATINGSIVTFGAESSNESLEKAATIKAHSGSCRMAIFDREGTKLYACGSDRSISISDVETGKAIGCKKSAHNNPTNCLSLYNNSLLLTGDDEGFVRVWDVREKMDCKYSFEEHGCYVSDMCCVEDKKTVLVTSGDGTLSTYDLRKGKLEAMCDPMEEELLCVETLKNGKKVVCGTSSGALEIFSWEMFGQSDEHFLGHPDSVDTICKVDENTICSGSSDGIVRLLSIHPNKLVGVIGQHRGGPVECVRYSPHSQHIVSCGHDGFVRIWDKDIKFDDDDSDNEDDSDEDSCGQDVKGKQEADLNTGGDIGSSSRKRGKMEAKYIKEQIGRKRPKNPKKSSGFFDGL